LIASASDDWPRPPDRPNTIGYSLGNTMLKNLLSISALLAALLATSAHAAAADPMMDMAKAKNCLACHTVATKLVGPAYADVAEKYKGDKAARDKLAAKVVAGGTGVWGAIPMPANPQVSLEEAKKLVDWVLIQKK
jgi:cytochrome c